MNIKHTMYGTRIYRIWKQMRERCKYQSKPDYKNYGGRGIAVCKEWDSDFTTFYNWAIANGYTEQLTLDRIDVNGNYCPENCRWATKKQQSNNTRANHWITFNGETHTISEWGDITGIGRKNVQRRIADGWTIERALTEEVHKKNLNQVKVTSK